MAKKIVWIIVIVALWVLVYSVDKIRVDENQKPWFCFPIEVEDNGFSNIDEYVEKRS